MYFNYRKRFPQKSQCKLLLNGKEIKGKKKVKKYTTTDNTKDIANITRIILQGIFKHQKDLAEIYKNLILKTINHATKDGLISN